MTSTRRPKNLWFERCLAIAATANLALVLFDLTYVSWRNFWLQGNIQVPLIGWTIPVPLPVVACNDSSVPKGEPPRTIPQSAITCWYDPVKGIELHRDTQQYLNTVQLLEQQVNQAGLAKGLTTAEGQATLAELRKLSNEMIASNPFESVGKSGTLEKIKNRMRDRMKGDRKRVSAHEAFDTFWSTSRLTPATWQQEIGWFKQAIVPLMQTNYYRSIGENGQFTNNFWLLDAPFISLFAIEFLARTFYLSRRFSSLRWRDAMLWRWYDAPLFTPFSLFLPFLAVLRVLPTALRLHQAELIDLQQIQNQIRQGFVAEIAEDVAEIVVVQVISQAQTSIQRGELTNLIQRTGQRRYVDINNTNEVEAIATRLLHLILHQVFPKIQPDLEALLRQSIHDVLSQSPAYRGLQAIPGIGAVPAQMTERLVAEITQTAHSSLKAVLDDPAIAQQTTRLIQNFGTTLITEAQQQNALTELQNLLSDLLEEVKINYVQRLAGEDAEALLEETRQLHQKKLPVR